MASFNIAHFLVFSLCFAALFTPYQCIEDESVEIGVKRGGDCGTSPCPETGGRCSCCKATGACYRYEWECDKYCHA
ncbi:hypothetical protein C2S52_002738 [Perilla frutescens var. hirtella]|uniref:Uncharacterized protein n=1 Tax=Perilla frutescens var. hirtella TaxID=608512 RepID=A0AAD4PA23_PERFH|nr:hypothetical protein C2S51_012714 [Perilla frutescens var. frutescens]KAH6792261.1 hypothetical protein C2S52_002738 [Perilla frutescens var. hirtella]KAH6831237.1 hypothetical protein C2S53_009432 [Perilla frutescens var. hirtella]